MVYKDLGLHKGRGDFIRVWDFSRSRDSTWRDFTRMDFIRVSVGVQAIQVQAIARAQKAI